MRELRARRKRLGPEPVHQRSSFIDWNYNAELFAFAKRLNEEFNRDLLQQALTERSFIVQEEKRQRELGIEEPVLNVRDNADLVKHGEELLSNYVGAFIRYSFPRLPYDGMRAIQDYLCSDEVLAHVSQHIGTKDLILTAEPVPDARTLSSTLKAVVSALQKTSGDDRAFEFVRDFVATQLNQKDLNEIWTVENPFEILKEECSARKMGEPEPRDIGSSATNTILACYRVGIYCNKQLLSAGFGENVEIAVDVAALTALNKFYEIDEGRNPLNFNVTLKEVVDQSTKTKTRV